MLLRVGGRLAIWLIAVLMAITPPLYLSNVWPWQLSNMANAVNKAGFFRDFFFITVVLSALSFSSLLESVFVRDGPKPDWLKFIALVGCLYYFYMVFVATLKITRLAAVHGPISDISTEVQLILITLAMGLLTELGVSLRDWYYHLQTQRRGGWQ